MASGRSGSAHLSSGAAASVWLKMKGFWADFLPAHAPQGSFPSAVCCGKSALLTRGVACKYQLSIE